MPINSYSSFGPLWGYHKLGEVDALSHILESEASGGEHLADMYDGNLDPGSGTLQHYTPPVWDTNTITNLDVYTACTVVSCYDDNTEGINHACSTNANDSNCLLAAILLL